MTKKERIIEFFLNFDKNLHQNALPWFSRVVFLVAMIFICIIQQDVAIHIQKEKLIENQIETHLAEQGEELITYQEEPPYESDEGLMRTFRVHSSNHSYLFYLLAHEPENLHIFDISEGVWRENKLDIPPIVTQAFIYHDIGIPNKIEKDRVFVNNGEYIIDYTPYRVEIKDIGIYAPLPHYSKRTNNFIEKYIGASINELQVTLIQRMSDYELVYLEHHDNIYRLRVYYTGEADIAKMEELN